MTIRVLSFDFDGCLCHEGFEEGKVVSSNQEFLDGIKSENSKYSRTIVLSGSNRQSYKIDTQHHVRGLTQRVGSSFPALNHVADYLGAEHNLFLLADLLGNKKLADGESYQRALYNLQQPDKKIKHEQCPVDATKVLILFTQIQKMANLIEEEFEKKHQAGIEAQGSESIAFFFYDDSLNILDELHYFFKENSELLPKNVTVHFNHYCKKQNEPKYEIHGTGIIDKQYEETVKKMVRFHPPSADGMLRVADFLDIKQLIKGPEPEFYSEDAEDAEEPVIFQLNMSSLFARRAKVPISPFIDQTLFNCKSKN